MHIRHSPSVHLSTNKKQKKISYQIISPRAVNSLKKRSFYILFEAKQTEYHSVYNSFTTFKMYSTVVTVTFSIIGESRL